MQGKTSVQASVAQQSVASELGPLRSLAWHLTLPSSLTRSQAAGAVAGGVDGGSAFLQAIMGVRLVPVTLSAVTLDPMPSCTFQRPFSAAAGCRDRAHVR